MDMETTEQEQKAITESKQQEIAAQADIAEHEVSETKLNEIDKQAEQFEEVQNAQKDRDAEWRRSVIRIAHSKKEQREDRGSNTEPGTKTVFMISVKYHQCGIVQDILRDWKKRKQIQESRN